MKKVFYGVAAVASVAAFGAAAYRMLRSRGPDLVPVDDPRFAYSLGDEAA